MKYILSSAILGVGITCYIPFSHAKEEIEGKIIRDTTAEFLKGEVEDKSKLSKTNFFNDLQPFALEARAVDVAEIKSNFTIPNLGKGDPNTHYKVILQPGHYGRTSETKNKKTGASGKNISEQKIVAFIAFHIANSLIKEGINVLVIPADDYNKSGLKSDIFLSIHADGSKEACATGPSLGYKPSLSYKENSNILGMHSIGFALAYSMGFSYDKFMKDNFTTNLRDYYAFKDINTRGYAGVLEIGELSCPAIEKALIKNALLIAKNVGVALKASVDIINEPRPDELNKQPK